MLIDRLGGMDYPTLAIKYGYSITGARGMVSRARRNPQMVVEAMIQRTQNPHHNKQVEAQQAIIAQSRAIFDQHLRANPSGKVVWLSDVHIPYTRYDALELAYKIISDVNPVGVTGFNDFFDFAEYGRWANVPTPSAMLWQSDISNALEIADMHHRTIKHVAPRARIIGLNGNHDNWMLQYMRSNKTGFSERNITEFMTELHNQGVLIMSTDSKQEPVATLGALKLTHGISAAQRDSSVGVKTIETLREGRHLFYTASGHVHRDFTVKHGGVAHFNFGCLCVKTMPYVKHKPNRWQLGIGVLEYSPDEAWGEAVNFHEEGNKLVARYGGHRYEVALRADDDKFPAW